jgi:hypothetical protein
MKQFTTTDVFSTDPEVFDTILEICINLMEDNTLFEVKIDLLNSVNKYITKDENLKVIEQEDLENIAIINNLCL